MTKPISLLLILVLVVIPGVYLFAQGGDNPVLESISFSTPRGQLQMHLDFSKALPAGNIKSKKANYPERFIVGIAQASISGALREGVIYQDILSDGSRGVGKIEVTYDQTRDKIAFTIYPLNGLDIGIEVEGGSVTVAFNGAGAEAGDEQVVSLNRAAGREASAKAGIEERFSLDEASINMSPELEGIIRAYFNKKETPGAAVEEVEEVIPSSFESGIQPAGGGFARPAYRIQVGDTLALAVVGEPELELTVQVRPDGFIGFPIIGDVYVEGKTTEETRRMIKRMLQPYYNYELVVDVIIKEFTPEKVYLLGKVYDAGPYPYKHEMTLLDLVGRYDEKEADIRKVKIIRGDEIYPVDMEALMAGDTYLNYELEPGDYIVFPALVYPRASILGKVKIPGEHPFQEGQRLIDLVGIAGGFADRCDIKQVLILRVNKESGIDRAFFNLLAYQQEGDITQNPVIMDGDVIIVPEVGRPNWEKLFHAMNDLNTFAFWWRYN